MKRSLFRKGLVIGIIILFVGAGFVPIMSGYIGDYDETLYPPWDEWDHFHASDPEIFDNGYETGDLYSGEVYVNIYAPIAWATWARQESWHNTTWTCPQNNWYTFTFDYFTTGTGMLQSESYFFDFAQTYVDVFFMIFSPDDEWLDPSLYNYSRRVFHAESVHGQTPYAYAVNEHVPSDPIYLNTGDTITILAGISIFSSCLCGIGYASVVGYNYEELNYIEIAEDTSVSPLLRVSPDPPAHNFGEQIRGEEVNWTFNIWNGGIGTLEWTASDDRNWIEVAPTSGSSTGEVVPTMVTIDTTGLSVGYYSGHVTVDASPYGLRTGLIEVEIINLPPVADANGPYYAQAGQPIMFDASDSYDIDGTITGYRWDWTDDGEWDTGWLSSPTRPHTYLNNGMYTIRLQVKDNDEEIREDVTTAFVGIDWEIDMVTASRGIVSICSSLNLDSYDRPWIAYARIEGDDHFLECAHWDGNQWVFENICEGPEYHENQLISLALDSNNYPHIVFITGFYDDVYYAHWTGSTWDIQPIYTGPWDQYCSNCVIVIDSQNRPHVCYSRYDFWTHERFLYYLRWTGAEWDTKLVEDGTDGIYLGHTSMVLDSNDKPHISYFSGEFGEYGALKYAYWNGSYWVKNTIESSPDHTVGSYTSIDLDSNEAPHISYYEYGGYHPDDFHYLRYTNKIGGSWNLYDPIDDDDAGSYTSIKIDSNDAPHISYLKGADGDLGYAVKQGTSWATETVDSQGNLGAGSTLELDSSNMPHISYFEFNENYKAIRYATLGEGTNSPPFAHANGPYSGNINENIVFDASASFDFDGSIIGYRWDWTDDGEWDTEWLSVPQCGHMYPTSDTYTVKLQVKDNEDGKDADTSSVEIFPDAVPPNIQDNTPSEAIEGSDFTFIATITDNIEVTNAYVEYWYDSGTHTNLSMGKTDPDVWEKTITIEPDHSILHYIISAKDLADNWANTGTNDVTIIIQNHPPYEPHDPDPRDGAIDVSIYTDLSWMGGDPDTGDTVTYDIYFGTNPSPPHVHTTDPYPWDQTEIIWNPGVLDYETLYYWKIKATDNHGNHSESPMWHFHTEDIPSNDPPVFSNEDPYDGQIDVPVTTFSLTLIIEDPEGDSFDWSIETSPDIGSNSSAGEYNGTKTCSISGLEYNTIYTWYVNATDPYGSGEITEEIYMFTTASTNNPPYAPSDPDPEDGATNVSTAPILSVYVDDPNEDTMDVSFYDNSTGQKIGTDYDVPSGERAYCPWPGREEYTTYSWYAVADDSEYTTKSDTWNFTTGEYIPELENAFIIGLIETKNSEGDFIYLSGKLICTDFSSVQYLFSGEEVIIHKDYLGYVGQYLVIGFFKAAVISDTSATLHPIRDRVKRFLSQ